MKIKYTYSEINFKYTVDFIAKHNEFFLGKTQEVEESLIEEMESMIKKFPEISWRSTMGFLILAEVYSKESVTTDSNYVNFNFYVDPSVSQDRFSTDDTQTKYITYTKATVKKE